MPHLPHRSLQPTPKPSVAEVAPAPRIERHLGTTRIPRPRVLKPPVG